MLGRGIGLERESPWVREVFREVWLVFSFKAVVRGKSEFPLR